MDDSSVNSDCNLTSIQILAKNWENILPYHSQYELKIKTDKTYTLSYKSYLLDSLGMINDSLMFFDEGIIEIDYCHVTNKQAKLQIGTWDSGNLFFMPDGKELFTTWFKLDFEHLEVHDVKIDTFSTYLGFVN
jgi:hypothetical protein